MHTILLNDFINGLFETVGAVFCWLNVLKILRDKQVRGVYWPFTGFFTAWGLWNLWYYPSLGQWWSFWGGVLMCTANGAWVWLAVKFRQN